MGPSYGNAMAWVERHVADELLPCAVLGVATSTGIRTLEAFSSASQPAVTTDSHFALFSITKPLVGLAAMRAVESGQLELLTPLVDAVPGFGTWRQDVVRLDHLLTHTSGIIETRLDPERPLRDELTAAGALFSAGTLTQYSSIAFDGIAALAEHATGRSIEGLVGEVTSQADASGLTFDRDVNPVGIVNIDEYLDYERFQSLRHAGAGMYGRAGDLLNLGVDILRTARGAHGVVAPSTLAAMTTPRTVGLARMEPYPEAAGQEWGLCWNLRLRAPGLLERRVFGHSGMAGAEWWIYPDLDLVFVLLTNVVASVLRGVRIDALHNAIVADHSR